MSLQKLLSSSLLIILLLPPAWATPPHMKARAKAEGDICRRGYEWLQAQPDATAFKKELLPAAITRDETSDQLDRIVFSMRSEWASRFQPEDLITKLRKIESGDFSPIHGSIGSDRISASETIDPAALETALRNFEDGLLSVSADHRLMPQIQRLRKEWNAFAEKLGKNDFGDTVSSARSLRTYLQTDTFKQGIESLQAASPEILNARLKKDSAQILRILDKTQPAADEILKTHQYVEELQAFYSHRRRVAPSSDMDRTTEYLRRFAYELDRHLPDGQSKIPDWIKERLRDLVARLGT